MEIFHIDLVLLIRTIGILGLSLVVFAESGLLIGFFLPGDSLLFTAGFLASQGYFNIYFLIGACFIAAVLGDSVGYAFGARIGRRFFTAKHAHFFSRAGLERAQKFYEHHGGKAIMLARFLPMIRTLAPILAGVGGMRYTRFLAYNLLGGALWAGGLPLFGYWLGNAVPNVDRFIIPIVIGVIIVTSLPGLIHFLKDKENRDFLKEKIFLGKIFGDKP